MKHHAGRYVDGELSDPPPSRDGGPIEAGELVTLAQVCLWTPPRRETGAPLKRNPQSVQPKSGYFSPPSRDGGPIEAPCAEECHADRRRTSPPSRDGGPI